MFIHSIKTIPKEINMVDLFKKKNSKSTHMPEKYLITKVHFSRFISDIDNEHGIDKASNISQILYSLVNEEDDLLFK